MERDALGRVIAEIDPAGRRREKRYDATGNLIGELDRDGKLSEQRTTSWNLVGEKRSAVGARLSYRYSNLEQITAIVDPNQNVSHYDYDLKERLVRVSRLGKVREEYVFDLGDHLVAKKDSHGAILFENEIDPESHFVAKRKLASGGEHRYRYDARGLATSASTERHDVQLRHDGHGRRLTDIRDGRGVERRYFGDGRQLSSVFDRFHTSVVAGAAGTVTLDGPTGVTTSLRFDERGLVARQCANGTWELSQYDDQGRLEGRLAWKRASDGALQGWSVRYEWTAEGDLVRIVDSLRGTTVYRTDAAHRLVSERTPEGQELFYELDLADNVLTKPAPGRQGVRRLEVTSGNRLLATDSETFTYDQRDHLSTRRHRLSGRTTHYHYDSFDMLVRLETRDANGVELEPAWEYAYDALGRRTDVRRGAYSRHFFWDGDRIAAEVMPSGAVRVYDYAGDDALVPMGFTDYASLDAPSESGHHYTVFVDPVGQPLQIEDARGQLVWWANRIDPYGAIEIHPSSHIEYNLRWPGHYYDPETELHYNRYRYYDPTLGRYLQTDPLGYEGSPTNLYGYPTNPLTDVDVLGLAHGGRGRRSSSRRSGDSDGTERTERPARRGRTGEVSPVTGKRVRGAHTVVEHSVDGEVVARYYIDSEGRTVQAEGLLSPPATYTKEGVSHILPEGFESGRDHRGHLIPERSVEHQDAVNVPENVIAEHGTLSNLSEKKRWENSARAYADENPGTWSVHRPEYDGDNPRPTTVNHELFDSDQNPIPDTSVDIENPE